MYRKRFYFKESAHVTMEGGSPQSARWASSGENQRGAGAARQVRRPSAMQVPLAQREVNLLLHPGLQLIG